MLAAFYIPWDNYHGDLDRQKIDTDSKAIQKTEFSEKIKNLNAIIAN